MAKLRLWLLLGLLLIVVLVARCTGGPEPDWSRTLVVAVHPYAAGSDEDSDEGDLSQWTRFGQDRLDAISEFFAREAQRHNPGIEKPFRLVLGDELDRAPDAPSDGGVLARIRWGFRMRWWRWRLGREVNQSDILVVARFQSTPPAGDVLHSVGSADLGMVVANVPAAEAQHDYAQVLLAHEILHTVGALDLYDPATGLPIFPAGYAEPNREPRYPQEQAELMAGRIPLAPGRATQATDLSQVTIGRRTAREIGWVE